MLKREDKLIEEAYNSIYKESNKSSIYLGNCITLIKDFGGYDDGSAVEWMQNNLLEDSDVQRISEQDFLKYVNINSIPKKAIKGTNKEFYFIKTAPKHPTGYSCNFLLYCDVPVNGDVHYFFHVDLAEHPVFVQTLPNGYGAGSKMSEA